MKTKISLGLIIFFVIFFFSGLLFGNIVLVSMGLVSLLLVFHSFILKQPHKIEIIREPEKENINLNETVTSKTKVKINGGRGIVEIIDDLPEEFELVDGNNYKVIWKGKDPVEDELNYIYKCTKRGVYELDGVRWKSYHPLGIGSIEEGKDCERKITVKPRLLDAKRVRGTVSSSKIPTPSTFGPKIGIPTMEIKELQEYTPGDPFSRINWKATARNISGNTCWPMINDYEKEGKALVWIFLDKSSTMALGTSVGNVFEYALEAANSLSYFYLSQGNKVGFCAYDGGIEMVKPGTGKRQYLEILREILDLKVVRDSPKVERKGKSEMVSESEPLGIKKRGPKSRTTKISAKGDLQNAVTKCRKYMSGYKIFSIIITRFTTENTDAQKNGIKEISKHIRARKKELPIMIVNVADYGSIENTWKEQTLQKILQVKNDQAVKNLKQYVKWIDWKPSKESFTQALLRGKMRR